MRLRLGVPLWLKQSRAQKGHTYPTLRGTIRVDVAVVGGGITGAGIAHAFAEAGVRVVLLESNLVARGSTAASTALLMQETDEEFGGLERRYGRARAKRLWQLGQTGVRQLVATLRRLRIDCDLAERDGVYFTTTRGRVEALFEEYQRRCAAGFAATWLNPSALFADTGIVGKGAIRTRGNAQLDPYCACIGLLRAATRNGARIFERSAVERIETARGGVVISTRGGIVQADRVIVATGYTTPGLAPSAGRFRMKHTYVLATRPLRAHERRELGLGDLLLWDTRRPYHYARWTEDRRLLLGGSDRPLLPPSRRQRAFASSRAQLREYYDALLPALKEIEIEYAWEGLFARTPDGLPYIGTHRRYPQHLFALGYGGNGMTFGFLAARLLLDAFLNRGNPDDLALFRFGRFRS
jgi:glycine/D-amino acid oxidase-like deaminating enzyme